MTDRELLTFYTETNELTGLCHWQHMAKERMLAILKNITVHGRRKEDRTAAATLALEVMKGIYK